MRVVVAFILLLSSFALIRAQDDDARRERLANKVGATDDVSIEIRINPEARVSVTRGGRALPVATCGEAMELPVKIVNQGFVTAPLQARLVEPAPEGVAIEFSADPLKGIREENRLLSLILTKAGSVDVTISFSVKREIPNLSGANRVYLFMKCR